MVVVPQGAISRANAQAKASMTLYARVHQLSREQHRRRLNPLFSKPWLGNDTPHQQSCRYR